MSALDDLIDSCQLEVLCRPCGWTDFRTLSWLSVRRDMNCPACLGVIVLNTSERRREILCLRRQMASLHRQLTDIVPAAEYFVRRTQAPIRSTPPALRLQELALPAAYRESMGRSRNDSLGARRTRR